MQSVKVYRELTVYQSKTLEIEDGKDIKEELAAIAADTENEEGWVDEDITVEDYGTIDAADEPTSMKS